MKGFPTLEAVEKADKEQLARWYRDLPFPESAYVPDSSSPRRSIVRKTLVPLRAAFPLSQ